MPIVCGVMRSRRTLRHVSLVSMVACTVLFALGTTPLPAPYHRYVVSGSLTRSDGSPAPDVIVVLLSRTVRDSALQISRWSTSNDGQPLSVTYPGGAFSVTVDLFMEADSLALGFIPAGRAMVRIAGVPSRSLARVRGDEHIHIKCGDGVLRMRDRAIAL